MEREPPPSYDLIMPSITPLPTGGSTSGVDSGRAAAEAIPKLVEDIRAYQRGLEASGHQYLNDSEGIVRTKYNTLEAQLHNWKEDLFRVIERHHEQHMEDLRNALEEELGRLGDLRKGLYRDLQPVGRVCDTALAMVKTGNPHDLFEMQKKLEEKVTQLRNLSLATAKPSSAQDWTFNTSHVTPTTVRGVMGNLKVIGQNRPSMGIATSGGGYRSALRHRGGMSAQAGLSGEVTIETTESHPERSHRGDAGRGENLGAVGGRGSAGCGPSAPPSGAPEPGDLSRVSLMDEVTLPKYHLLYTFQSKTYKDKARCHPLSFALSPDNHVIVPDKFNNKIKIFTARGQLVNEFSHHLLQSPISVALTHSGDIAVSDFETENIKVFTTQGILLDNYPLKVKSAGIAVNRRGQIVVGDTGNKQIHVVDLLDGRLRTLVAKYRSPTTVVVQTAYGPRSTVREQYFDYCKYPHYVAVDSRDNVLVSDRAGQVVLRFGKDGTLFRRFGREGEAVGEFKDPYGLAVDQNDIIYVADYSNNRIQVIDPNGTFLEPVITAEHELKFPTAVALTPDKKLIVTEYLSGLVKVFGTSDHTEEAESLPPTYSDVTGQDMSSGSGRHYAGDGFLHSREQYHRHIDASAPAPDYGTVI